MKAVLLTLILCVGLEPYFSPNGGCTNAIVQEITHATKTVHVQAYSFTSKPIADALIAAVARGVAVTLIVDRAASCGRGCLMNAVAQSGGSVYVDAKHAIAHNKIIIIDGATVLQGSFNFTADAEHANAENLLVHRNSKALADAYENNFARHLAHSTKETAK